MQADLRRETTQNANVSGSNQTAAVEEIPQQQAGPTAEAPHPRPTPPPQGCVAETDTYR